MFFMRAPVWHTVTGGVGGLNEAFPCAFICFLVFYLFVVRSFVKPPLCIRSFWNSSIKTTSNVLFYCQFTILRGGKNPENIGVVSSRQLIVNRCITTLQMSLYVSPQKHGV